VTHQHKTSTHRQRPVWIWGLAIAFGLGVVVSLFLETNFVSNPMRVSRDDSQYGQMVKAPLPHPEVPAFSADELAALAPAAGVAGADAIGLMITADTATEKAVQPVMYGISANPRPFSPATKPIYKNGSPRIALIIDDVGNNPKADQRVLALPAAVTIAILPDSKNAAKLAQRAKAQAHDVLVHMPMEPKNVASNNPGNMALRLDNSVPQNLAILEQALQAVPGAVGLNNHMGSAFTADRTQMEAVLFHLQSRGLMFVDSRTGPATVGYRLARHMGMESVGRDVFIDHVDSPEAIAEQLEEAERIARHKGYAVVIGHPYANTLAALDAWLPVLEQAGIKLVPVSTLSNK
jgi:polysaccharide deacetylase 2 family uncharacterized protein YibQ